MIWIIASIPFWIASGLLFLLSVCGILWATFSKTVPQGKFNSTIGAGLLLLAASGLIALMAAKICS